MTVCAFVLAAATAVAPDPEPRQLLAECRAMLPEKVEVAGRIVVRNRRGTVQAEHKYSFRRESGKAPSLEVDGNAVERPAEASATLLEGSSVTWSDLLLDYLDWKDVSYDSERMSESVHGQKCRVIVLRDGGRTVRVWLDKKTSALMQAEEECADGDKTAVRRLWGTRLKKFGERWAPSVLEVEKAGTGLRTKITIEELKTEETNK